MNRPVPLRLFKKNVVSIVRRPGMWPSSLIHREAGHTAKSLMTSLATDRVHFDVKNPTAYRACKSRGETMRDFRLPEPFDYRCVILTLKSLFRKSNLCLRTP